MRLKIQKIFHLLLVAENESKQWIEFISLSNIYYTFGALSALSAHNKMYKL